MFGLGIFVGVLAVLALGIVACLLQNSNEKQAKTNEEKSADISKQEGVKNDD